MTAEEIEKIAHEMKEQFPNCPNPIHSPISFIYFLKLYEYYKSRDTHEE